MVPSSSSKLLAVVRIIWILYAIALFIATHIPVPELLADVITLMDKVIHAGAYFVLAMLTFLSLGGKERWFPPSIWVMLLLMGVGAFDEYMQGFVNRYPSLEDWLSDCAGIFAAFLFMHLLVRFQQTPAAAEEAPEMSPSAQTKF